MGIRVLIVGPAHSVALEQWVTAMIARGHTIRVLSPDPPRPALAAICETTEPRTRIPLVRYIARLARIRRAVREFRPHIVHGHYALNYALWATLAARQPVVLSCWGSDILVAPERSRLARGKVVLALRRARYVTATSQALLEAARSLARRPLAGEVLHWGVDITAFKPVDRRGRTGVTILSMRAHEPIYNVDSILRAFAMVCDSRQSVRLVIAHSGSGTPALRRLAEELGITRSVDFIGFIEQADLPLLYQRADVYVSVPSSDASAVSNLEALASGLPVVASALPSTKEWIAEDDSGLLVEPRDIRSLAGALLRLVDDQALRERLGAAARLQVESRGSRDAQMDRASRVYELLAEGRLP